MYDYFCRGGAAVFAVPTEIFGLAPMDAVTWQAQPTNPCEQQYINGEQQKANQVLLADVDDLKNGLEAVEEHARSDLGLIKSGETFVQMSTASSVYSGNIKVPAQSQSAATAARQP